MIRAYLVAIVALSLAACGGYCEPGTLGTGLDCPSAIDSVELSPEYLAACGDAPVSEATAFWGLPVGGGSAPASVVLEQPGSDYVGETLYDVDHNARGRIVAIDGCTVVTTSCDPVVLAHELGHCLGYPDVDVPGDVMCHSTGCAGWVRQERGGTR